MHSVHLIAIIRTIQMSFKFRSCCIQVCVQSGFNHQNLQTLNNSQTWDSNIQLLKFPNSQFPPQFPNRISKFLIFTRISKFLIFTQIWSPCKGFGVLPPKLISVSGLTARSSDRQAVRHRQPPGMSRQVPAISCESFNESTCWGTLVPFRNVFHDHSSWPRL